VRDQVTIATKFGFRDGETGRWRPEDVLHESRREMNLLKRKSSIAKMSGTASVNGAVVAEAIMMCKLADRSE